MMPEIEEKLLRNQEYIIKKINILLEYAEEYQAHQLIEFRDFINRAKAITSEDIYRYKGLESYILEHLTQSKRKALMLNFSRLHSKYMKLENIDTSFPERYIAERIESLEHQLQRLMERPRLYEKRAEEKLFEIDDKFRKLMEISGRNSSITDNIKKVDDLEKKLSKLEADAQDMMSDISTVELGKQYLEAKNRYCAPKPKMKFSRSKRFYVRYPANIYYWLLWIFKRVFHNGFFLYAGFIFSLLFLTFSYFIVVFGDNQDTYKDLVITIPMIWLAWFFQRKINTRDKLFELYNHKQKVMETYVAFKNSAYDFKASDKMEEVLLEAIKKDPSECVGKDNTTIIEAVLDKLRGLFITAKAKRIMKDELDLDK
mgnify:CR=1 FL=1|jgi:hypothetical protein